MLYILYGVFLCGTEYIASSLYKCITHVLEITNREWIPVENPGKLKSLTQRISPSTTPCRQPRTQTHFIDVWLFLRQWNEPGYEVADRLTRNPVFLTKDPNEQLFTSRLDRDPRKLDQLHAGTDINKIIESYLASLYMQQLLS